MGQLHDTNFLTFDQHQDELLLIIGIHAVKSRLATLSVTVAVSQACSQAGDFQARQPQQSVHYVLVKWWSVAFDQFFKQSSALLHQSTECTDHCACRASMSLPTNSVSKNPKIRLNHVVSEGLFLYISHGKCEPCECGKNVAAWCVWINLPY